MIPVANLSRYPAIAMAIFKTVKIAVFILRSVIITYGVYCRCGLGYFKTLVCDVLAVVLLVISEAVLRVRSKSSLVHSSLLML